MSFLFISSLLSLLISSRSILKRFSTFTCEDENYKIVFKLLSSFKQSFRSRRILSLRVIKKQRISISNTLDIIKIEAFAFYILTSNNINKLFNIISSEIHNSISLSIIRNSRILVNESYLYDFKLKYKKYYKSYTIVRVNNTKKLTLENIKKKLSNEYFNFLNVFDRSKTNELFSYREYNYKLKFIDETNKTKLSRSRIYFISNLKLK